MLIAFGAADRDTVEGGVVQAFLDELYAVTEGVAPALAVDPTVRLVQLAP